jgi:hypothetical protein
LKLESSKYSDMKVQVADADMAVVMYRSNDKGTYKGKDITGEYRRLDVFVKGNGRSRSIKGLRSRSHKRRSGRGRLAIFWHLIRQRTD